MKKIVLTFGFIAGAILVTPMLIFIPMCLDGTINFDNGEIFGYTSMILAFLMVFFAIRSYRENVNGGVITFGRAMKVGMLVSLIACAAYVVAWEIYFYNFAPDFFEKFSAHTLARMRSDGATDAQIAAQAAKFATIGKYYSNPFVNIGMTFMEVFPISLIVTLISAAILRRKSNGGDASSTAAAATA